MREGIRGSGTLDAGVMRRFERVVAFTRLKLMVFFCRINTFARRISSPVSSVKGAITDRFGHMWRANFLGTFQICDGTADFQNTVIRPR